MTYTTEQKVTVEKVRFASKMDVLKQTADAEAEYDGATRDHRATLTRKIADIKAVAKDTLAVEIETALEDMRTIVNDGGENNE